MVVCRGAGTVGFIKNASRVNILTCGATHLIIGWTAIVLTSPYHCFVSSGSVRISAAIRAPWIGGLLYMGQAQAPLQCWIIGCVWPKRGLHVLCWYELKKNPNFSGKCNSEVVWKTSKKLQSMVRWEGLQNSWFSYTVAPVWIRIFSWLSSRLASPASVSKMSLAKIWVKLIGPEERKSHAKMHPAEGGMMRSAEMEEYTEWRGKMWEIAEIMQVLCGHFLRQ